jgi:hypothetical protein
MYKVRAIVSNKHINANAKECDMSKIRIDGITGNAPFINLTKSIGDSELSIPMVLMVVVHDLFFFVCKLWKKGKNQLHFINL